MPSGWPGHVCAPCPRAAGVIRATAAATPTRAASAAVSFGAERTGWFRPLSRIQPVEPPAAAAEDQLRAARRGETAAFNALVQTYQRQVYNVCYRTLGNAEDAADATQDSLLSAFRGIAAFNGPAAGLRGWLLRIAVNACYDQLRRRQRRPADSLEL